MKSQFYYHVQKNPQLGHIINRLNPIQTIKLYFITKDFNVTLTSVPRSFEQNLSIQSL
jgi:hypothetical protein